MPPLRSAAALGLAIMTAALAARPAAGAPAGPAAVAAVLLATDVGESAQATMPPALWRRLAGEYVGNRSAAEEGAMLPDGARCASARAQYAVLAQFDRAVRLPGLGQDIDRAYAVARFTVRNCRTGTVAPTKTVRIEAEPGPAAERAWEQVVRATLARDPLVLRVAARIVRVENEIAFLEGAAGFTVDQTLHADAAPGTPAHPPIELVVIETTGRYVLARIVGKIPPHVGDYVEAT